MILRYVTYPIVFFVSLSMSLIAWAQTYTKEQLAYMPATEQIKIFKAGTITPVDVLEAQVALYHQSNKEVNAVTHTYFKQAMQLAKESTARYKNGTNRPLEGITVAIKDEHYDKGWKVSQGSLIHKDDPPQDHAAPIVKKLKAAGAIPNLQTTVPELYLNYTTSTKAWGVTKNPWNLQYTVGGSSGGSGAALAAGYSTLATGSDMGGSIRIPAAVCGLYGYKPAFGQVHTDLPLSSFSGSGPMARTFKDMVLMFNVISGPDKYSVNVAPQKKLPMTYPSIKGMKIAYVGGMGISPPTKEVQQAMDKAIKVFEAQGAMVDRVKLDFGLNADQISEQFSNIALAGAMGGSFTNYAKHSDKMTNYANYFIKKASTEKYGNKQLLAAETTAKDMYKKIVDTTFSQGYDVIIAPTMPTSHIPAAHDFTNDKVKENGKQLHKLVGSLYTIPFNILNWMPVINVPVGLSSQGMPIGLQIIGKANDTDTVFKAAAGYSEAAPELYSGKLMPPIYTQ